MTRHRILATALVVVGAAASAVVPAAQVQAATACTVFFDTNSDGFDDLAVGTPGEDLTTTGSQSDAGTVTLVQGDASGMFGAGSSRLVTQEDVGLVSQAGDRFGAAVASADLNGDGCGDLAIGVPGESGGVGAVVVLWGSTAGTLDFAQPQVLRQGVAPVGGSAEPGDGFGATLAVTGSLPSGGAAALWVGSPGEDVGSHSNAGLVTEIRASAGGLLGAAGATNIHQDSAGVPGAAETEDRFGERLSGGGRTLLVGVPHEDVGSLIDAGSYYVFTVSSRTWQTYSQDTSGVPGTAERGDRFGSAVAHGAGCDGATDETWAVGAPGEDIGSLTNAGTVTLRDLGNGKGVALQQGAAGIPGTAESSDGFGGTLVDAGVLVVGSAGEAVGSVVGAGAVSLVELGCTAASSPAVASAVAWHQATSAVPGDPATDGRFTAALGASLVGVGAGPLQYRLVVGSPGQTDGGVVGAGTVTVFGTDAVGLTRSGSVAFGQGSPGIMENPEPTDGFGGSLDASNSTVL